MRVSRSVEAGPWRLGRESGAVRVESGGWAVGVSRSVGREGGGWAVKAGP